MRRVTIRDIAKAAGVSASAASFALNDRPGVSEQTRARVKQVADELGWSPNVAALALSGQRARAIGLVIARSGESVSAERFFMSLITGIEQALTPKGWSLVLQMVPDLGAEIEVHRRWWAERRVDGVVLVDMRVHDPRYGRLRELGVPTVLAGPPPGIDADGLVSVLVDNSGAMATIVTHLADHGRRRLAYVPGSSRMLHVQERRRGLEVAARERGAEVVPTGSTDFSEHAGHDVTADLLAGPNPPDALIYDNEMLALGGLVACHEAGLVVPDDVAIVSFEDSPICRVVTPPITALRRDPAVLGAAAADLLLSVLHGGPASDITLPPAELVVRGSSDR